MRCQRHLSGQAVLLTLALVAVLLIIAGIVLLPQLAPGPARNACVNCLRQIVGAKEQWALENKAAELANAPVAEVCLYIKGGMPVCEQGGTYHFNVIGLPPQCSNPRHILHYNSPCSDNLKFLNKAVQLWLQEHPGGSASNLVETNLFGFGKALARMPECPAKGGYSLDREKGLYACSQSAPH